MINLRISLFGPMRIVRAEDESEIKLTHTIQVLLAYLLLKHGRFVSREELAGLFWGECDQRNAHDCLNTALWRLRSSFRLAQVPDVEYLVSNCQGEIRFNYLDNCWLDIVEFETLWQRVCEGTHVSPQQNLDDLNRATALYQGDLLEGLYEDWLIPLRERFRLAYLNSLARLMDYYRVHAEPRKSLEYGQRILALDPLREDIHRDMMQLYLDLGQRAMAVNQYRTCCMILAKELNIAPMSETQDLYNVALSMSGSPSKARLQVSPLGQDSNGGTQDALRRVQLAVDSLDEARRNLDQAMKSLERYL